MYVKLHIQAKSYFFFSKTEDSDHEPISGWSESLGGYNGIVASYYSGLKRVHVGNALMELIPVDLCVKGMIIASERNKKGSELLEAIPVYNAAGVRCFTINTFMEANLQLQDHLFDRAIGIPSLVVAPNNFIARILQFFLQILPAVFIDALLVLFKRKPMVLKMQRILIYSEHAVEHFQQNEFFFENSKYIGLGTNLAEDEKDDFSLIPRLPMLEYIVNSFIVSKVTVCNETAESAARAKKKTPYWKALGWVIKSLFLYIVYKVMCYGWEGVKNCLF